jgi:hypothetical protein
MVTPNRAPLGCDAVIAHSRREIPEVLWHYTSFSGLKGIVESKTIWASEYRFLNDVEEFQHAKNIATDLIEQEPEYTDLQFPARNTLREAVTVAFQTGFMDEDRLSLMVSSFSEAGDQLSQWRGYAGYSTGVSIGLDLRHLRPLPPSDLETPVTFAPCVYAEAEKRALLKAILGEYRDSMQVLWNSIATTGINIDRTDPSVVWNHVQDHSSGMSAESFPLMTRLQWDLLRIAPLLKNESFSEEREWRLVLPREAVRLPTGYRLQFRVRRDTLVPFIAFPLLAPGQEGPIFCRDVIIGPDSHASAALGVSMFLLSQQIPLPATASKVPYRSGT